MQDWQRPYLYLTLMTANARPYTFDLELAWRYSDITTPPADEHRMPVGASALARAIGIPYTTVRRNLKGMVAEGRLIHAEGGPTLFGDFLRADAISSLALTYSPLLVAGNGPRIAGGAHLEVPVSMELHLLHEQDGTLLADYRRG